MDKFLYLIISILLLCSCGISEEHKKKMEDNFTYTIIQDYADNINLISKEDKVKLSKIDKSKYKELGKYQAYFCYSFIPLNNNYPSNTKVSIYGIVYFDEDLHVNTLDNGKQAIEIDMIKEGLKTPSSVENSIFNLPCFYKR